MRHAPAFLALTLLAGAAVAQPGPDEALRTYLAANGMLNRGFCEQAAPEYERFLAANPEHEKAPVARYGLGVCLHRMGRYEEAREALAPLSGLRGFAFGAEVELLLGHCALAQGDDAEAAARFTAVVERYGDHASAPEAAAMLVEALHRAGDHAGALVAVERVSGPARDRADLFAALSEMAIGRDAQAERRLASLLKRSPSGEQAEYASLLRAQCLQRLGRDADAAPIFQSLAQRDPFRPQALLGQAQCAYAAGDPAGAARVLDELLAIKGSPAEPGALLLRARIDAEAGRFAQAQERLKRLEGDEALADDAAYWSARCEMGLGRAEQAAGALADAIARFPRSELVPSMMHDRALALRAAGQATEAAEAARAVLESSGASPVGAASLHLLAAIAHDAGDHGACAELCDRFLKEYPKHALAPSVEFLRAESLYLAGDLPGATRAFERFLKSHADDPQAPGAQLRLGLALWRSGDAGAAAPHLARAAGSARAGAKDLTPAFLALGDIRFAAGDWSGAESLLREYLAVEATGAGADDAMMRLALALQRQDRHEEAIAACDAILARSPRGETAAQARFERGQSLLALGRDDQATAALEEVVERDGDSRFAPHALSHLGAIASRRGDHARAAELFERAGRNATGEAAAEAEHQRACALLAAGRYNDAADAFERFARANPDHPRTPEARARRAIALSRDGRAEEAVRAFDALERDARRLDAPLRALVAYERAWDLRALGRDADAEAAWKRLVESDPPTDLHARALADLAGLEMKREHYDAAAALLERALTMAGDAPGLDALRADAAYRLSVCELRLGRFDSAAARLDGFGERHSGSPLTAAALLVRGEALFSAGKFARAAGDLEQAVTLSPEREVAGPALLRLGECRAAMQQWSASEEALASYLERFPDSDLWFQARFGLGWACENQGRLDEAIAQYGRVIAAHQGPTAARAQFQVGECLFAQKKHEEAVREFLKVDILFAVPEWSAAALYEAGRCFEELARPSEARRQYQDVVDKHADTQWAALAAQRLEATRTVPTPGRGR